MTGYRLGSVLGVGSKGNCQSGDVADLCRLYPCPRHARLARRTVCPSVDHRLCHDPSDVLRQLHLLRNACVLKRPPASPCSSDTKSIMRHKRGRLLIRSRPLVTYVGQTNGIRSWYKTIGQGIQECYQGVLFVQTQAQIP